MRLHVWILAGVAACAPAASVATPAAPSATPEPPPPPVPEPVLEAKPEPEPPPPPPRVMWTPTFLGSGGAMLQSAVPVRLGGDVSKPTGGEKYVIRFERTACFGSCATYTVELWGDGKVVYRDEEHNATGKLPPADVAALAKRLADAGFFRLTWDEPCKQRYTDSPGAIVTLVRGGRKRTITDDYGNLCIPKLLRDLESDIDHVAATTFWPN